MWADHDLGFLDLLLDRRRHRLVGSFHNCEDTFVHTIRFPRRLRRFDAIILMSRTQEPFFLKAGVDPARIHVVPHGVDTDYFRPAPRRVAGPLFTVLAAGGYRRNFPLLREVCLRLKNEPAIRFEIVAPESWRPLFQDVPNARFGNALADADFLEACQTCSCLLQTVENATANNVILEAMACGQPVVAESIGGIPEYVDATCSILAPPGDAAALAGAILELRASPAKRDTLAAGARKRAEALDWNNIAARMREIYGRL
jgi:glycosyltransferase involved in cell wall biosynthesis